jgi:hypothetical protein
VSAARTARRLVRAYPRCWRARYGEELAALVVDMCDGRRVSWRARADVIAAGGRERLRTSGLSPEGSPAQRARGGASLVLWAWALFVFAGGVVQKSSEHWQQALPTGSHELATIAFDVLIGVAIAAGVLVLAGIAVALPSTARLISGRGWEAVRSSVLRALIVTAVMIAGLVALVLWAHGLSGHQRNGGDAVYGTAVMLWALVALGGLLTWTSVAVRIEQRARVRAGIIRIQGSLAVAVTAGMIVMALATAVWWAAVAVQAPAALTGSNAARGSAAVPQLILAMIVMLTACALASRGARLTTRALPCLRRD